MYFRIVQQCIQALRSLELFLDKAEIHAEAKKFDVEILMHARLAPDQRDFIYQVTSACDYAKAAAGRLAGETPPVHDDVETTLPEARARIRKTIAYMERFTEAQYVDADSRKIGVPWRQGRVTKAVDYVMQLTLPNVFFHVTMAYAILRHNGVDLGKMDYLGFVAFEPAESAAS